LFTYALGRKADSDAQLATLTREHAGDDALEIAEAHAYRGEGDDAFRWLDRAYAQKGVGLYLVKETRCSRISNLIPATKRSCAR